ncbi:MAG: RsmD family RNA methyltransferase [Lentisphaeria bacterium]|nr:RsmD family RNA methyltransferase [Lentisphaeria bacterium]
MEIISGSARGVQLTVPAGMLIRPTAVRARKALFDSLGDFSGVRAADLCAGAGGLGLEAASRGATEVLFVEKEFRHCNILERNIAAVAKAGVSADMQIRNCDLLETNRWCSGMFDVIFADPPYPVSANLFNTLLKEHGAQLQTTGALLIWEIPDTPGAKGFFMRPEGTFRKFGATEFLLLDLETLQI